METLGTEWALVAHSEWALFLITVDSDHTLAVVVVDQHSRNLHTLGHILAWEEHVRMPQQVQCQARHSELVFNASSLDQVVLVAR